MTRMTPLSNTRHSKMGWTSRGPRLAPDATSSVRLCLDEIPIFAIRMPVVFRVVAGRAQPVIPVGALQTGETPLLDDTGGWRPRTVPFDLRRGPFEIVRTQDRDAVFVDESELISSASATMPLFDSAGAFHKRARAHLAQLSGWHRSLKLAEVAATLLHRADLLLPWPKGGVGFYVAASDRIKDVAGDTTAMLHAAGALRLAHASELSLGMIEARPVAAENDRSFTKTPQDNDFLKAMREEFS